MEAGTSIGSCVDALTDFWLPPILIDNFFAKFAKLGSELNVAERVRSILKHKQLNLSVLDPISKYISKNSVG